MRSDTWLGHRELEVNVGVKSVVTDDGLGTRGVREKMNVRVEVWLTEEKLHDMIRSAAHNKSGKSKAGPITVNVVSKKAA